MISSAFWRVFLDVCTILGGLSGAWYLWDRLIPKINNAPTQPTMNGETALFQYPSRYRSETWWVFWTTTIMLFLCATFAYFEPPWYLLVFTLIGTPIWRLFWNLSHNVGGTFHYIGRR